MMRAFSLPGLMRSICCPLLVALAVITMPGLAAANEGLVLFVSGEVTAQRGDRVVALRRGVRVREGDTIRTGPGGRTHIRMRDSTLFSLRPDTDFVIETYRYDGPQVAAGVARSAAAAAVAPAPDSAPTQAAFGLLRGGFRAITGLIGRVAPETFNVRTPVATIGIRGTTFTAVCLADCSSGLVFGVSEGEITANNAGGQLLLASNEYGYVASAADSPQRLASRPPQLDEDFADAELDEGSADEGDGVSADGDRPRAGPNEGQRGTPRNAAAGDETVTAENESPTVNRSNDNPPPGNQRIVVLSTPGEFPQPGTPPIVAGNVPSSAVGENDGQLTSTPIVGLSATGSGQPVLLQFAGAPNAPLASTNQGFDPVSGIRWGRFAQGTVRITEGGQNFDAPAADIGPHWVLGPDTAVNAALPRTGSAEFVLVGNTDPTSTAGARGFLGNATLTADFVDLRVQSTVALSIDNRAWQAEGSGQFGAALGPGIAENLFAGVYDQVRVDGAAIGNGQFSGLVTSVPTGVTGAALGYQLMAPEIGGVAGVAIFQAVAPGNR